MNAIITVCFITLFGLLAKPSRAAEAEISIEDLAGSVAFLYQVHPSSHSTSAGSGFLVQDDSGTLFLVTASHVASDLEDTAHLVIRSSGTAAVEFPLSDLAANPKARWVHHKTADVAALRLKDKLPGIAWSDRFISTRYFRPDDEAPDRSQLLVLMGFPLTLGVAGKFSPITKRVLPASDILTLPRADTHMSEDFFLVDSPTIEGYSGAPVFAFPSDIPFGHGEIRLGKLQYCAGLVHGTLSDKTGGKLGAIVPGKYVLEVLKGAAAAGPK